MSTGDAPQHGPGQDDGREPDDAEDSGILPLVRDKPGWLRAAIKFGLVGASGVLVNLLVLEGLHGQLGWGFTRSSAIATETAIITNYIGNELWTFHKRRISLRRFVQFNAVALAGLFATVTVATILERLIDYRLAQLVGIGAGALLNFTGNFRWTWR